MADGQSDTIYPIPNGDFESGSEHWEFFADRGDCRVTDKRAANGGYSLQIIGDKARKGAKVVGPMVPVDGPGVIELQGQMATVSGRHLGIWIHEFDGEGNLLPDSSFRECVGPGGQWQTLILEAKLRRATTHVRVFFLAYPDDDETIECYVDDLVFVRPYMPIPPWPSQYKLGPADTARLTAADVVGPDGIVYPNWRQVGVQGGIPEVPTTLNLADLGAVPGRDIAPQLQAAVDGLGDPGGAILIGDGTYFLDTPVNIAASNVVIRGSGRDSTTLIFRGGAGRAGHDVGVYWPPEHGTLGPDSVLTVHAYPIRLKQIRLSRDGQEVVAIPADGAWTYLLKVTGETLLAAGGPGVATLTVSAEYRDGRTVTADRVVTLSEAAQVDKTGPDPTAALYFQGRGIEPGELYLAEDGRRGDTTLTLASVGDLAVGQSINLHAPISERFATLTRDRGDRGSWKRVGYYRITAIAGNRVTINQPLRIDFPADDGSYVRRLDAIEYCGVEDLTIEHVNRLPIDSVSFNWCWNSWVRNVKVVKTGRHGAYAQHAKWIEIRDCVLEGAWNTDGGQAYAGFTRSADCLWENSHATDYRHGPVVQFGAMGNVFRNSTFDGSDLQWHAGWSTENLFENCVVHSRRGHGSYGYAAYATGSRDKVHGPNGPRNVVYNCDFTAESGGLRLDGVNENWIIVHNRIDTTKGAGLLASCGSFDLVIQDNVFILRDETVPMVSLDTPDCVGADLVGNTLYGGNGELHEAAAPLARDTGNVALPAVSDGDLPPRPSPTVPSIYDWQTGAISG